MWFRIQCNGIIPWPYEIICFYVQVSMFEIGWVAIKPFLWIKEILNASFIIAGLWGYSAEWFGTASACCGATGVDGHHPGKSRLFERQEGWWWRNHDHPYKEYTWQVICWFYAPKFTSFHNNPCGMVEFSVLFRYFFGIVNWIACLTVSSLNHIGISVDRSLFHVSSAYVHSGIVGVWFRL